jgi:Cell division protein CrgA
MPMPRIRRRVAAPAPTSGRYTPPKPKTARHSALWVPSVMFTCLGAGLVIIVGNYLEVLPGGKAQNSYLVLGLVLLIAGFGMSTQYK